MAFVSVVSIIIGYLVGVSVKIEDAKYDLIKTVNHINLEGCTDVEKVYTDADKDIAYYMYVGTRDVVTVGDTVYFGDTASVVTSIDIYGFTVEGFEFIKAGDSGKSVYDTKRNQIGFISELLATGEVYCIWS